jgi:hypothetical protein
LLLDYRRRGLLAPTKDWQLRCQSFVCGDSGTTIRRVTTETLNNQEKIIYFTFNNGDVIILTNLKKLKIEYSRSLTA